VSISLINCNSPLRWDDRMLEINGLRPWSENRMAIDFAGECGKPVISGGDRHALEANTVLNLTNAATSTAHPRPASRRSSVARRPRRRR